MTPRDVTAPKGALAWVEGSGPHPGRWVYDDGQRATLRALGAYVLDVRDGVVPGIIGAVPAADFMALAARLDRLEGARRPAPAEPVRVLAPEGAVGWVEAFGVQDGRWVYDGDPTIIEHRERGELIEGYEPEDAMFEGERLIDSGELGAAPMGELMSLAGRVDALVAQLDVLTRGPLAIVADVDRRASGEPSRPPFAETS